MKKLLIVVVIALLISGCSITPQTSAPSAVYDFGPQYADNIVKQLQRKAPSIMVANVASPIWFDNHAIHYRLAYHNPTQFYSYANSRWVAAPAALLTRQISNYITNNTDYKVARGIDGVQADYALHIILEDFSQVFDSLDKSYAVMHLNASLIERRTRLLLAQRNFSMQQETSTADAVGAVNALVEVSKHLNNDLINWLTKEITSRK